MGSIYLPEMNADSADSATSSDEAAAKRPVHDAALQAVARRLCRADEAPWLHGEVARRMADRLAIMRAQPAAVIDWWSVNGASGALLKQAYPRSLIQRLEPRAAQVALKPPGRWWSRRSWTAPALPILTPQTLGPQSADLVWANMMLHWKARPQQEMQRWFQALAVDGFLMFSTLGPGSVTALRRLYERLGWGVPHAPFVDMHDLGDMLVHAGFAEPVMDQEILTLSWAEPASLLAELRTLGGNADPGRFAGLRTPRWHQRLLGELDALRSVDGRYRLDFEVVYGHAFRPPPRPRIDVQTSVPLDEMRAMVGAGRRTPGKPIGLG
ncbi:MAG: biotin synthase [Rubrivivax sp.]